MTQPPRTRPPKGVFRDATAVRALGDAWAKVRANGGCAGGDGETIAMFQPRAAQTIAALSTTLRANRWRPRDLRMIAIPKRSGGTRPLSIPAIRDRIAQTACAAILTPVLEPLFSDASYAYRPGRSVDQAVRAIDGFRRQGFTHVVEADILRCFERIPHDRLLDRLSVILSDHDGGDRLTDLIALWMEHWGAAFGTPGRGLAQGSPLSPLLANLHLDALDDAATGRGVRIVRFADDFVLLCKGEAAAHDALASAAATLEVEGLELRPDRTRITSFDKGFRFLGHLFVRSMMMRELSDPDENPIEMLRSVAGRDADDIARQAKDAAQVADARDRGHDRGARILYVTEPGRRLTLRNLSFSVEEGEGREILALSHGRVDRIELGPDAEADVEALRHALFTDTDLAFVDRAGGTLGWLSAAGVGRAALHLAQARVALDDGLRADAARRIAASRIKGMRTQLRRLNRGGKDAGALEAASALGRAIRKLPGASDVAALRGHEGAAAAIYWPALGRLITGAATPFRRSRPAADGVNAAINWLTGSLGRDVRAALARRGLHSGFGLLHTPTNGHEALVWDLMEPFRAPLTEGLAAALFNQRRLRPEMFATEDGQTRIDRDGRRALIEGYETAVSRVILSPHSGKRRTWRHVIVEDAGAFAAHCRAPEESDWRPFTLER